MILKAALPAVSVVFLLYCQFLGVNKNPESFGKDDAEETVWYNARIYTGNKSQMWAQAVAFKNGKITAVGSAREVFDAVSAGANRVDVKKLLVMPGFQDPHVHLLEAGVNEDLCVFSREAEREQYEEELKECLASFEGAHWVLGAGIAAASFSGTGESARDFLDRLVPGRPVLILDDLGHAAFANSEALKLAGYADGTKDPKGGILARDSGGRLTGVVYENAQQALRNAAWEDSDTHVNYYAEQMKTSLRTLAQSGITSVSDAGGFWAQGHVRAWKKLLEDGALTVRASNALYLYPDRSFDSQLLHLKGFFSDDTDSLLRFNQIKIYVDGILSLGTGALKGKYKKDLGLFSRLPSGFLYFDQDVLERYVTDLEKVGFQMHFHVTGDLAVSRALDAVAKASGANRISDRRHRITHLYLVDPKDQKRFRDLGVIADFQMPESALSGEYTEFVREATGHTEALLPLQSMDELGVKITLSSDWDADPLSPFEKISNILREGELKDVETVVRYMTRDVAYLLHQEDKTGTIQPGKYADMIVLDRNIFTIEPDHIADTRVLKTVVGGRSVYTSRDF